MAVQLTPPTKNTFYVSVFLGLIAFILYLLGVFGAIDGGFDAISHYAFWIAMFGWLAMAIGVAAKGI